MTPSKAAKKVAKKAASKAAKKSAKHAAFQDLRRAYEHLGRVEIIEGALTGRPYADVASLAALARKELADGDDKNAADLLRAAEHLCFAALAPPRRSNDRISTDLEQAIYQEFGHLTHPRERRWAEPASSHEETVLLHSRILSEAFKAFDRSDFRPALELARAAEALTHIVMEGATRLPASAERARIAS